MLSDSGLPSPTPRLNVVGCGKLGTTLARLLAQSGQVSLGGLYSRAITHAKNAANFTGDGSPCAALEALPNAELWLLAVPDDAIAPVALQLAQLFPDWSATSVFHCSGTHNSALLKPLQDIGASTASLHPVHSFADPQQSLITFAGTCCTLEGQLQSQWLLTQLFSAIGARIFPIQTASKSLYHTATVMASNYLVSLLGTSLALLEKSGLSAEDSRQLLTPLVMQTTANIFAKGSQAALTGPIARGDCHTVTSHIQALQQQSPETLNLYRELGLATVKLAAQARPERGQLHLEIENILSRITGAPV